MDAKTVRDTAIKPKLIEIFGNVLASSLLVKAISAGGQGNTEQERLQLMVDAICSDPKVIGMWGVARATKQKQEWMKLL
jgi:hypothetical protein